MVNQFTDLEELVRATQEISSQKTDFHIDTRAIEVIDDSSIGLATPNYMGSGLIASTGYKINPVAEQQIASTLDIPKKFYDSLPDRAPGLRAEILRELFAADGSRRLIRTVPNKIRAFLSNRYKPLDNDAFLSAIVQVLTELIRDGRKFELKSSSLTEKKMYVQITFPDLAREVISGDYVLGGRNVRELYPGVTITNSEVGHGARKIESFIWDRECSNGLVGKKIISKYHVGDHRFLDDQSGDPNLPQILRPDTLEAMSEVERLETRDAFYAAANKHFFDSQVQLVESTMQIPVNEDPKNFVENVTEHFVLSQNESGKMLNNLTIGGDLSLWGAISALTAVAHDTESRDRQYEIERTGYQLMTANNSLLSKLNS